MRAAIASAGQSFKKLKALIDETGREWTSPPVVMSAPDFSAHDPRNAKARRKDRVEAVSVDGPLKLSSGERRILTALAQYPDGRTKVQVAVLTGLRCKRRRIQ
jgi:hypothetical protein